MFLRVDKLQIELPAPKKADPNAAAAVQELLGGRFGEMSTLMNYLHQSVAFKEKKKLRPFYELVASITAEEVGHVELVSATINALLDKTPSSDEPETAPYEAVKDMRYTHHFIQGGPGHTVANSHGAALDRRLRIQLGEPGARSLAQFFPGVRRPHAQGASL